MDVGTRACVGSHTQHATPFVILIYGFTHIRNDSVQVETEFVGLVLTDGAEERLPCLQLLHKQWSDITLKQIQLLILLCKSVAVGTVWQLATKDSTEETQRCFIFNKGGNVLLFANDVILNFGLWSPDFTAECELAPTYQTSWSWSIVVPSLSCWWRLRSPDMTSMNTTSHQGSLTRTGG